MCVRCAFASRPKRVAWLLYIIRTCEQPPRHYNRRVSPAKKVLCVLVLVNKQIGAASFGLVLFDLVCLVLVLVFGFGFGFGSFGFVCPLR